MNVTPRAIPPFLSRRALALQPLPHRELPALRSQEGEFLFAGRQRAAANDPHGERTVVNAPVLLAVIALSLFAIALGVGLVLLTNHYFAAFAKLVYAIPEPWAYAVPAAAVSLLCVVLNICVREYREGEVA